MTYAVIVTELTANCTTKKMLKLQFWHGVSHLTNTYKHMGVSQFYVMARVLFRTQLSF